MTRHKAHSDGRPKCGGDGITMLYWGDVDCVECLAVKPPDVDERTSIKRSHRAEGVNWVD